MNRNAGNHSPKICQIYKKTPPSFSHSQGHRGREGGEPHRCVITLNYCRQCHMLWVHMCVFCAQDPGYVCACVCVLYVHVFTGSV